MAIRGILFWAGTAALMLVPATTVSAHHSFAMFDNSKTTEITGTVSDFEWINPHVWLHIEAPNDAGAQQLWSFEAGSPSQLTQSGWNPASVIFGETIKVVFHPLKDGSNGGQLLEISKEDGATLCQGAECRAR